MVIIQRHILGIIPFNTPYQYFAADINLSGSISTFDLVQLRRMILGIETGANIPIWRFIDEDIMDDSAPWSQTNLEVEFPVVQAEKELTIMAIKVGDLNGNVNPNGLHISEPRTGIPAYPIALTNHFLNTGSSHHIPLEVDLSDLEGLQFQLNLNGAELLGVQADFLTDQQYVIERNRLKICWDTWTSSSSKKKGELVLEVEVTTPNQLKNILQVATEAYPSIALTQYQEEQPVGLQFTDPIQNSVTVHPNPFTDQVTFTIPTEKQQPIHLSIYNLHGALIYKTTLLSQEGNNQLQLDRPIFPNAGIFFYQIQSETALFSDRVILQENK